jgi:hypothetical protein
MAVLSDREVRHASIKNAIQISWTIPGFTEDSFDPSDQKQKATSPPVPLSLSRLGS